MDLSQLIQILEQTVSPEHHQQAQAYLEQGAASNLPEFLKHLSDVLANGKGDVSAIARSAAGLQLKNALTSKDAEVRAQYQARWLAMPDDTRNYIKRNVISALGTETSRPSMAAQCVAYIAVTEIPQNFWPDVIRLLTQNITNPASTELMREANLEAIGYICQDIDPDCLVSQSNEILTAIVHGMRREEPSNHVKLAATNALLNSLEFTRANFEQDTERHFIMQVVCESTQSDELKVRVAALQCLVKIMSLYYQFMEHYMGPALFAITVQAMKSEHEEIALQGIEFWSNVCDEEVDLQIEASEALEQGRPPSRVSRHYAKGALQYLVPILVEQLTKQDENDDDEDWNPCKAAGVCLMLMATCCENDIIQHVIPFVTTNITNQDWRFREAAIMAFGSILEGPDPDALRPYVEQALPMFIGLMEDSSVHVRDTTAWALGRICELVPEAVLTPQTLAPLLNVLITNLQSAPRVASNVCWAFNSLADAAYENSVKCEGEDPETYALSQFFEMIVAKLLETTERPDANQNNLRSAAYEALMEMIKHSAKDCYSWVQRTTMIILQRLQQVLQLDSNHLSTSDRAQYNDLASLLCATLQSVLRKMTPEDAPQISDTVMQSLVLMFNTSGKTGTGVQEDALMAVGTLIETLNDKFMKYMDAFRPYLIMGLKNHAEYQICSAAVGIVADLTRSLGAQMAPYCDEIMTILLENLSNNNVHRSVKPQILSVFGDIALAIGPEYKKYLDVVLTTCAQAAQMQVDKSDYDMIEYGNELRESIMEAYTGIVQGLKGDKDNPSQDIFLIQNHVQYIIQFIIICAADPDTSDSLIGTIAGLIGDLMAAFGPNVLQFIDCEAVNQMLLKGKKSKQTKTRTLCVWAVKEIKKMKAGVGMPNSTGFGGVIGNHVPQPLAQVPEDKACA